MDMSVRRFYILLGVLVFAAFGWYEYVSYTQYQANMVFLHDAGVFDALAAGPRHGNFLRSPIQWDVEANYFAGHFRPILFVIMPLYFVVDHVMTLLSFFNLALALAAVPLGLLAFDVLRSKALALGVAFLYLTNHFVLSIHLAMHPESVAFVGFFGAMLALHRRRPIVYALCLLWTLSVKEDYGLWVGFFGVSLFLRGDRELYRWAVATTAAGFAWWIMTLIVMPLMGQEAFHAANNPMRIFAHMGDTKGEVFFYMLTHPLQIAGQVLGLPLFWIFASAAFLPLLDWRSAWLIPLSVAPFLVTDTEHGRNLLYYYSYPAVPFVFYGAIYGLRALLDWKPNRGIETGVLCSFVVIGIVAFVFPTRTDRRHGPVVYTARELLVNEVIRLIPKGEPVAAQYHLFTKVPNRPVKLPLRARHLNEVRYVLLDELGRAPDLMGDEMAADREELFRRLWSEEFSTVFEGDGYILLRRNP